MPFLVYIPPWGVVVSHIGVVHTPAFLTRPSVEMEGYMTNTAVKWEEHKQPFHKC